MLVATQNGVIRAGESLSNPIDCTKVNPVRIIMPSSWVGGNQSKITFQVSYDANTWYDYFDSDGQEIYGVCQPNTATRIDRIFGGHGTTWVKIRAGTRDQPMVQAQDCTFIVVTESTVPPASETKPAPKVTTPQHSRHPEPSRSRR